VKYAASLRGVVADFILFFDVSCVVLGSAQLHLEPEGASLMREKQGV
jgi:hypothetical protein